MDCNHRKEEAVKTGAAGFGSPLFSRGMVTSLPADNELLYNEISHALEVFVMAGIKQQVIQMIQSLPDEVSLDDVMAELYFKMQVEAGLKELDAGNGIPHEEVERRMSKWLTA